jgi:serine/threonine protein kinase
MLDFIHDKIKISNKLRIQHSVKKDLREWRLNNYHLVAPAIGEGTYSTVDIYKLVRRGIACRKLSAVKNYFIGNLIRMQCPVYGPNREVCVESGIFQLKRELGILNCLRDASANIVQLNEVIWDETKGRIVVIFDYAGSPVMQYKEDESCYSAWTTAEKSLYRQVPPTEVSVLLESDFVACMKQLLSALSTTHQHGVVHKDIKPENVLLSSPLRFWKSLRNLKTNRESSTDQHTEEIHLTICDFNTAENNPGGLIYDAQGSTLFLPPEVIARDENCQGIDGYKRDVWSLGILACCLISSQIPVDSAHRSIEFQLALMALREGNAKKLCVPTGFISDDGMRELIESMLSIDPSSRPTASEALQILNSLC